MASIIFDIKYSKNSFQINYFIISIILYTKCINIKI